MRMSPYRFHPRRKSQDFGAVTSGFSEVPSAPGGGRSSAPAHPSNHFPEEQESTLSSLPPVRA